MNRIAQYLQLAVLAYFLVLLILFLGFETLGEMVGMVPLVPETLVNIVLSGFILFLATWGATQAQKSILNSHLKKLIAEMNEIKAKLYDYEHPKAQKSTKPVPQKNQDEIPGILKPRQNFTDQ